LKINKIVTSHRRGRSLQVTFDPVCVYCCLLSIDNVLQIATCNDPLSVNWPFRVGSIYFLGYQSSRECEQTPDYERILIRKQSDDIIAK